MLKEPVQILVIDDDEDVLITAEVVLKQKFKTVHTCPYPNQIPDLLAQGKYSVVLLDMNYSVGDSSGKEGLKWLDWLHKNHPQVQVVMITAYGELNLAVQAMKRGAVDFVTKPWQYAEIQETVGAAHKLSQTKEKVEEVRHQSSTSRKMTSELVGDSPKMQAVFKMVEKVAPTEANVLILGENGTGKELVAREIHAQSNRSDKIFVTVDMGSLTESLFESELFGHKKGAFTDAKADREGRFEAANNGTIFLDEIGNLSLSMQSKLLSVLQKRTVVRVGENQERPINVRVLAATNMNLESMVKMGSFREDLLYRLNTIEIELPSLRERVGDITSLAKHFLDRLTDQYGKTGLNFSRDALNVLKEYHWPGNVRELEHTIERSIIMSAGSVIEADDLLLKPRKSTQFEADTTNLEALEKRTIEEVIKRCDGNMSKVAKELGIGRTTLYRKMEKYGL
ncbi:MAG: sigma-54-dependent Fis family transcriptional regulator [Cytophagia bacterium]|nr:sigma-54-dependent Fis family transcriptional regulator [Cytophagia bacterium]